MLRLTLVRHATTEWNRARRYQGWSDPPLSEAGRAEALRLRARLAGERWDRVVTSGLRRARETAALALPGTPLEDDPRLRELGFGAWEGLTWQECLARDGDRLRRWTADPGSCTPPEGEPLADFGARVTAALDSLPPSGSVLWVTHAGTLHAVLARLLGVALAQTQALRLAACGITRADLHPGGAVIHCVNDTAHLKSVPPATEEAP